MLHLHAVDLRVRPSSAINSGILLFTLVRGFSPFEEENQVRMLRRIEKADVDYAGWEASEEVRHS